MNNLSLPSFLQFLTRRSPLYWAGWASALLALFGLVYFVTNYAFIRIDVTTEGNLRDVHVFAHHGTATTSTNGPGMTVVPRATTSLTVMRSAYQKSIAAVSIPWHGFTAVSVELQPDKNATKLAFASDTADVCASYNPDRDALYDFDCTRPAVLSEFVTPTDETWYNRVVARIGEPNRSVKPYRGGVIGISYATNTQGTPPSALFYIGTDGKRQYLNTPEGIDLNVINLASLTTDEFDPTNNRFVLATWDGALFLGTPTGQGSEVAYVEQPAPEKYNPMYERSLCSLRGARATCFQGVSRTAPRETSARSTGQHRSTSTFTTLTDDGKEPVTVSAPAQLPLGELTTTADGAIFGQIDKTLYAVTVSGQQSRARIIATNVDRSVGGGALYFVQDGGVYRLNQTGTVAQQVFFARNIVPRGLLVLTDRVIVLGHIKGAGEEVYAYELTDDENTTPGKRLIDLLPAAFADLPDISKLELVDERVRVLLKVTYNKQARSAAQAVSPEQVAEKRENVLNTLRARGVDTETLQIEFRY